MRCLAAASSALQPVLAGPARPSECLGVTRGALYLRTAEPPGVLAVLCHDAVRLPCGLLLPATSAELPLTSLAAASAGFVVGDNAVRWTGPVGPVAARVVREWAPARPARGEVSASALAAVRSALGGRTEPPPGGGRPAHLDRCTSPMAAAPGEVHPWIGGSADPSLDAQLMALLAPAAGDPDASVAVAERLLGRGQGLTPSGDDVLAGFLVGAAAFGVAAAAMREAIATLAPARTTALSAALLAHAARGECIDELAGVAAVLITERRRQEQADRAVSRLLAVGHSSGRALARGLVIAAGAALHEHQRRAA
jgi:hypothetical protein